MKKIILLLICVVAVPAHAQLLTPDESAVCSLDFQKQGADYKIISVTPVLTGVTEAQCESVLADTGNSIGEAITSVSLDTGADSSTSEVFGAVNAGSIHFEYGGTGGEPDLSPTIMLYPSTLVAVSSPSDNDESDSEEVTYTSNDDSHRMTLQMKIIELLQKLISLLR